MKIQSYMVRAHANAVSELAGFSGAVSGTSTASHAPGAEGAKVS